MSRIGVAFAQGMQAAWAALLAGSFVLSGCPAAHAAGVPDARRLAAEWDRYIERTRSEWQGIGLSVAVVKGDEVLYARGFGVREQGRAARVDASTLFQVGSTTKAFTGAALGILVDEDRIRWDDPVIQYLPDFQLSDPWVTRNLTIRDIVTHRSGFGTGSRFVFDVMDAGEVLRQIRYEKPEGAFRDSYHYSNLMYAVAGKVIAVVSGMPWQEFIERRLLRPLEMSRSRASAFEVWKPDDVTRTFLGTPAASHVSYSDSLDGNVAMPHLQDDRGTVKVLAWQSYENAAAAGALVSSASDMANWLILNLNEGVFAGRQILKGDTVSELHSTQNLRLDHREFPFEESLRGYAMGWVKARYRGVEHLSHGGGVNGFPAYMALLPEQKLGIVVLANGRGAQEGDDPFALHKTIAFSIFDRLLGKPPQDWSRRFLDRERAAVAQIRSDEDSLRKARPADAPPSFALDRYAGEYEDSRSHSGRISVRLEKGQLVLAFSGAGAFSAALEHWHHDVFRLRPELPGVWKEFPSFILDAEGQVSAMIAFDSMFERLSAAARQ